MILDYLDKVREKPRAARKRFAFFTSVGLTAIIAIVWAFTLPARLASLNIAGDDMLGSVGSQELDGGFIQGEEGLQEMSDEEQNSPDYVPPEVREQLQVPGFLQGGGGSDPAALGQGGVGTSSTKNSGSSTTPPVADTVPKPRPIIIVTSTSSAATTRSR